MDFFSKMLTFQFLLSIAGNDVILTVIQSPTDVSAMEGDTVTMTCWINNSSKDRRIEWIKILPEQKTIVLTCKGNTTRFGSNYTKRTKHFLNDTVSTLSISHINLNDTGVYLCEVLIEIPPPVYRKSGNGTNLQVQVVSKEIAASSNDSATDSTRWILISCVSSIALIVTVTTFFLARRLIKLKKEEPMYVNVKYRNKAGQNYWSTEAKKYTVSSSCGDLKTVELKCHSVAALK
ncbi:cytotoxic T-lymphocyte protein 4-like isoform X2 [Heterodontus francisci]|uniref:cytotoxic T-lymphocyte protein 4-like isoform X2 n=1 Tax=Heterodontus francisci TaxID=7792 RepID=UPI00355BC58A